MSEADATPARVSELAARVGARVRLSGWLYHRRSSGKLQFLEVRDGTGIVQCVVFKGDVPAEAFDAAGALPQEASLEIVGQVRADPRSPLGVEVGVESLRVLQGQEGFPIAPKEHGVAFLLEHRHLWLRSRRPHAILRIRSEVERAAHDFLESQGYLRFDTPILTPNACEGTTTLFETDYFDEKAYLAQSGQLYAEAGAMAFGRVYCFGPTFRAEKSKTRRHLMEFWMIEPEAAFLDLDGDVALAEGLICAMVARVLERCRAELAVLVRPLVPNRDVVIAQVLHIARSLQKPQQLVNDRSQVQLLGSNQRKSLLQIESHLVPKPRARAGAGAICLGAATFEHVAHEVFVLMHDAILLSANRHIENCNAASRAYKPSVATS